MAIEILCVFLKKKFFLLEHETGYYDCESGFEDVSITNDPKFTAIFHLMWLKHKANLCIVLLCFSKKQIWNLLVTINYLLT